MKFTEFYNQLQKKSKTEKGQLFEQYINKVFQKFFSENNNNIKDVLLWSDWKERPTTDLGVDLVIVREEEGQEKLTAIQCKYLSGNNSLSKRDVDSFLGYLSNNFFSDAYIVTTAKKDKISNNLLEQLGTTNNIGLITYEDLESSYLDWDTDLSKIKKQDKLIRNYQVEAIDSIEEGFKETDRGKLVMACGTGKTYTVIKLLERLNNYNTILYVVPTLSLVQQAVNNFVDDSNISYKIFVNCSDRIEKDYDNYDNFDIEYKDICKSLGYKTTLSNDIKKHYSQKLIKDK